MNSANLGIEEARKRLGDLITAAQQGADIVITRNGRPVARLTRHQEDPTMLDIATTTRQALADAGIADMRVDATEARVAVGRTPGEPITPMPHVQAVLSQRGLGLGNIEHTADNEWHEVVVLPPLTPEAFTVSPPTLGGDRGWLRWRGETKWYDRGVTIDAILADARTVISDLTGAPVDEIRPYAWYDTEALNDRYGFARRRAA